MSKVNHVKSVRTNRRVGPDVLQFINSLYSTLRIIAQSWTKGIEIIYHVWGNIYESI